MSTNTCKSLLTLILFLTANSFTLGTNVPDPEECPFTTNEASSPFFLNGSIEIRGLQFDEVCTRHQKSKLANALKTFFNRNVNCACSGNDVRYTDVIIKKTTPISGDPGSIKWCKKRNKSPEPRFLIATEEEGFSDRNLDFDSVTYVRFSSTGYCGNICPDNKPIDSGIDGADSFPGISRQLTNKEDNSRCYGPLFVQILNENGFEGVIGFENFTYKTVSQEQTPFAQYGEVCR